MEILRKIGFYLFARQFVAGENIEDALQKARELKKRGIYSIINILGEHVKDPEIVDRFCNDYLWLIFRMAHSGLDNCHISVKPSQLGLDISETLYLKNQSKILKAARNLLPWSLVEIDAEERKHAKVVKEICLELAKKYDNLRLCRQVNLESAPKEIEELIEAGVSIRLCKGAYEGDIKDSKEIRRRFLEQATLLAEKGKKPVIATHDLSLIDELSDKNNLGIQVLLGIENKIMFDFAKKGKEVGFYLPCGPNWFPYGKRRWKSIVKILWRNWCYKRFRKTIDF